MITYKIIKNLHKLRAEAFELIHRTSLKPFLYGHIPNRLQNVLLEKHIKKQLIFPTAFSIELTNACNAKCWFCSQPLSSRKKGFMDFALYKKIINEILPFSNRVKSIALFMDGEPTLHPQMFEFLKYSSELGIERINISSNMELFTPKLTDAILNANLGKTLQYVICSLDGTDEESFSKNRIGVDFQKALFNTKYLIKAKNILKLLYPEVFTRLLISDLSKNEVEKFKIFWRGKADKILCYKMHNWGGQITDKRLGLNKNNNGFVPCYFPFSQFAIQFDGDVRLCCMDTNSSEIIGNVYKQSIKEIWNNVAIAKIRKKLLNKEMNNIPSICVNCSYPKKRTWIAPFYWYK